MSFWLARFQAAKVWMKTPTEALQVKPRSMFVSRLLQNRLVSGGETAQCWLNTCIWNTCKYVGICHPIWMNLIQSDPFLVGKRSKTCTHDFGTTDWLHRYFKHLMIQKTTSPQKCIAGHKIREWSQGCLELPVVLSHPTLHLGKLTAGSSKNHPIEKENHLPNLHFLGSKC